MEKISKRAKSEELVKFYNRNQENCRLREVEGTIYALKDEEDIKTYMEDGEIKVEIVPHNATTPTNIASVIGWTSFNNNLGTRLFSYTLDATSETGTNIVYQPSTPVDLSSFIPDDGCPYQLFLVQWDSFPIIDMNVSAYGSISNYYTFENYNSTTLNYRVPDHTAFCQTTSTTSTEGFSGFIEYTIFLAPDKYVDSTATDKKRGLNFSVTSYYLPKNRIKTSTTRLYLKAYRQLPSFTLYT